MVVIQISQIRVDNCLLVQMSGNLAEKVAIRAFAAAIRPVDINPKRAALLGVRDLFGKSDIGAYKINFDKSEASVYL